MPCESQAPLFHRAGDQLEEPSFEQPVALPRWLYDDQWGKKPGEAENLPGWPGSNFAMVFADALE